MRVCRILHVKAGESHLALDLMLCHGAAQAKPAFENGNVGCTEKHKVWAQFSSGLQQIDTILVDIKEHDLTVDCMAGDGLTTATVVGVAFVGVVENGIVTNHGLECVIGNKMIVMAIDSAWPLAASCMGHGHHEDARHENARVKVFESVADGSIADIGRSGDHDGGRFSVCMQRLVSVLVVQFAAVSHHVVFLLTVDPGAIAPSLDCLRMKIKDCYSCPALKERLHLPLRDFVIRTCLLRHCRNFRETIFCKALVTLRPKKN